MLPVCVHYCGSSLGSLMSDWLQLAADKCDGQADPDALLWDLGLTEYCLTSCEDPRHSSYMLICPGSRVTLTYFCRSSTSAVKYSYGFRVVCFKVFHLFTHYWCLLKHRMKGVMLHYTTTALLNFYSLNTPPHKIKPALCSITCSACLWVKVTAPQCERENKIHAICNHWWIL